MSRKQRIKEQGKRKDEGLSKATMCLNCHLIVSMYRNDNETGWIRPNCSHIYMDKDWLIRKASK